MQIYTLTKAIQADLESAGLKGKGGNWYSTKCMIPSNARIIDFVVSDKDLQARGCADMLLVPPLLLCRRLPSDCMLCQCYCLYINSLQCV